MNLPSHLENLLGRIYDIRVYIVKFLRRRREESKGEEADFL